MIRFFEYYSLKTLNTFGIDVSARYFFEFTETEDLKTFVASNDSWKEDRMIVLGGGSNILFLGDFDGLVFHPNSKGIYPVKEDRQHIWIEAGAGENWDEFVQYTVDYELGGIENLSFIPGNVGAAPVQSIGAYGQEAGNCIETVKGFDLMENKEKEFSAEECEFSYRNSIFKRKFKNRFIITSVVFKLNKFPEFNLDYGSVLQKVETLGEVNLKNVRQAVIDIRNSKLPQVEELPNAGSFFKNPVVPAEKANRLKSEFPELPVYPAGDEKMKVAAGWLIEKAGWKGFRDGDAGVHEKQALVLVNYGNATGKDIFNLSEKIKNSVKKGFDIELETEVNCV